jgi:hypothetical protein
MPLVIRSLHAAPEPELLNEEWIVIENTGPGPLSSNGWAISTVKAKGQRPSSLGTLQPGFVLKPGERMRLVTGTASKKAQGTPPSVEDGLKNYHLFLKAPVLARPGAVVVILLKQLELARATFDPEAPEGVRVEGSKAE